MRLQDIMTSPVETVMANAPVELARQRMVRSRIHHLVVRDEGGALVGVISDRDLDGPRARAGARVGDVMTPGAITTSAETTLKQAANLLRGRSIGCLPIVNGRNHLVGIVTVSDLLTLLGRGAVRPVVRGERWTLKHRGERRSRTCFET